MRQLAKYSFVNAKIRALLSNLFEQRQMDALLDARDFDEAVDLLKKTPYGPLIQEIPSDELSLLAIDKVFIRNDLKFYKKIGDSLAGRAEKEFVSLLAQRYEIEELKVLLRIWHNKRSEDWQPHIVQPVICFEIDFKKLMSAQTIEEFILLLDHTPYKAALLAAREKYKAANASFYLEASLDVDYYQRVLACISRFTSLDQKVARKILGIEVDIENINWLVRLRKYYGLGIGDMLDWLIPGGQWITKESVRNYYTTDGLTKVVESVALGPYAKVKDLVQDNVLLLEGFLYEFLLREIKRSLAGFPFTIGTVMGYLVLKRKETNNIVSILQAKKFGWRKEEIEPLLSL
jgi:V/A-type H+-transporting ATPase subunit C